MEGSDQTDRCGEKRAVEEGSNLRWRRAVRGGGALSKVERRDGGK